MDPTTTLVDHPSRQRKEKPRRDRRSRKRKAEEAEERRLTARIFGGAGGGLHDEEEVDEREDVRRHDEDDDDDNRPLFEIDRVGGAVIDDNDDDSDEAETERRLTTTGDSTAIVEKPSATAPVWVDEEDAKLSVDMLQSRRRLRKSLTEQAALTGTELEQRLRERYATTTEQTARTDWAELKHPEDSDQEDNDIQGTSMPLLRSSRGPLQTMSRRLPPHTLAIERCPDANLQAPSRAVVRVVQFHKGSDNVESPLLLTAGLDKTLRFFKAGVDGSQKVHSIHFDNFPIFSASFLGTTPNVIVASRRRHFYIYDAVAAVADHVPRIVGRQERSWESVHASPDGRTVAFNGNDGFVVLYDCIAKQWICDLKLNGQVRSVTFSPDGSRLWASGTDGDVYQWDARTRKCLERFSNQDGTPCLALAVSDQHVAVGAKSGVVNLYNNNSHAQPSTADSDDEDDGEDRRTPIKSILNLQSRITTCRFNGDGQILAMATNMEDESGLKLLHVPTATVFANWPTVSTPLSHVWSVDFSSDSRFLAVGNDKGKCLMYQLKHYADQ